MPLTKPLNNNCLIEVIREHAEVSRFDGDNTSMSYGRLLNGHIGQYHITASAGVRFDDEFVLATQAELDQAKGSVVRWEEFAEGGQTFEEDGKTYALVPWWRLIAVTEEK